MGRLANCARHSRQRNRPLQSSQSSSKFSAAARGDAEKVELLLLRGASVNSIESFNTAQSHLHEYVLQIRAR